MIARPTKAHRRGEGPVPPPFCAFNGGNDVWADIGNKRVGVTGLSRLLELPADAYMRNTRG